MDVDDEHLAIRWAKTDAGRAEIQARALVRERAQRNLLLVIDGTQPAGTLLSSLAGISIADFHALASLGLIAPVGAGAAGAPPAPPQAPSEAEAAAPLDYSQFTAALTRLISQHLGLRGFMLTLAVEKASTIDELRAVARRALDQIRERRGDAVADAAQRMLYGA